MTSVPEDHDAMSFLDSIVEEDKPMVLSHWDQVVKDKVPIKFQTKIRKPWKCHSTENSDMASDFTTILCTGYPDLDSDGNAQSLVRCLMDISEQRWIQDCLRSQVEATLEMKGTQENFIDMTFDEIRSPLSAVLHCADEIITALDGCRASTNGFTSKNTDGCPSELGKSNMNLQDVIKDVMEAAHTILYRAQHRRRTVDGL